MKQEKANINLKDINRSYLEEEGYKYGLVYFLNNLFFGDITDLKDINSNIVIEAFFFNDKKELHFFEDNGYEGVITENDGNGEYFIDSFELKKRLGNNLNENKYSRLEVINYLDYDESDFQAYIKYTALKGVK